jgi:hypothetical protein
VEGVSEEINWRRGEEEREKKEPSEDNRSNFANLKS